MRMEVKHIFQISQRAMKPLVQKYGSPLLILSTEGIRRNYLLLKQYLPRVRVFYAIKANPDLRILQTLQELGSSFDVASAGEIELLHSLGVPGEKMIYANPVKTKAGLVACGNCQVTKMTFDSASEIAKLQELYPQAQVLLRLRIQNTQALVDLNKKFGASREQALELLQQAQAAGLQVVGLSFHVGSQTISAAPYKVALEIAKEIFTQAEALGIKLRVLDIGGGFPIVARNTSLELEKMLSQVNTYVEQFFPDTEIWCEPGRYICGTAVNLLTSVIGVTARDGQPWYFLDEGLYGTFSGVIFDNWDFELLSFKNSTARVKATFAGPSCDSLDIMFRQRETVPLERGDVLLVPSCGAYTSASATNFNGFSKAPVLLWEEVSSQIEI